MSIKITDNDKSWLYRPSKDRIVYGRAQVIDEEEAPTPPTPPEPQIDTGLGWKANASVLVLEDNTNLGSLHYVSGQLSAGDYVYYKVTKPNTIAGYSLVVFFNNFKMNSSSSRISGPVLFSTVLSNVYMKRTDLSGGSAFINDGNEAATVDGFIWYKNTSMMPATYADIIRNTNNYPEFSGVGEYSGWESLMTDILDVCGYSKIV